MDTPVLDSNRLQFTAFDRHFDIYLRRNIDLMADKVDIEVRYADGNKPSEHINDFFTSNYYSGFVEGESRSNVICYFEKNSTANKNGSVAPLIYAQIQILNNKEHSIYYIEPLIDQNSNSNKYLVYRVDDIESDILSNNIFK